MNAYIFPGQGAQFVGMGLDLYEKSDLAKELFEQGYDVILIREETSPEDVHGMHAANAILTSRGGMTSHAALVARGWGKCCIVGSKDIKINTKENLCLINNKKYSEMDWFTLNGSVGKVYDKQLKISGSIDMIYENDDGSVEKRIMIE